MPIPLCGFFSSSTTVTFDGFSNADSLRDFFFFLLFSSDLKMNAVKFTVFPILSFMIMALAQVCFGQGNMAPSPAPIGPPSNDGTALDQGIACVLLAVALAVTYLVH